MGCITKNVETIVVLEKPTKELRCPYNCDGGDVTVNPKTGKCRVCGKTFNINVTSIKVKND